MRIRKSFIIGIIITLLLLIGAVVAYYLSQQRQDVRQRASEPTTTITFGKAVSLTEQEITTTETFDLSKDFTIEFWIKPDTTQNAIHFPILNTLANTDDPTCSDYLNITGNTFNQSSTYEITSTLLPFDVNGETLYSTSRPLPLNEWSHVALTVSTDGMVNLFVNGGLADTKKLGRAFCSNSMIKLGSEQLDGGTVGYFKGQLDELRLSKVIRYPTGFAPASTPFVLDESSLGLWHFNDTLTNEFSSVDATSPDTVTYVDSTIASVQTPVCQGTISTCSWDAADSATSYIVNVDEILPNTDKPPVHILENKQVNAPATSATFVSEANKTYTCEVTPVNACGTGAKGSATASCVVPTPTTPIPTPTVPTPTVPTPTVPTPTTPIPTPTVPTPTVPTPTVPTPTVPLPTATAPVATATTAPTATNTPVPGVATDTPTPTIASPGSAMQTFTIAGGILLTILGALILFAL